MRRNQRGVWGVLLGLALVGPPAAQAADWQQWRGPQRDGTLGQAPVETWPANLTQLWQVPVGLGHSSPVVVGEQVFIFSREDDDEVLRALALADGKELWKVRYTAPFSTNIVALGHGKGPKSTPAVADGRVCTFGITGILSCFATKDGSLAWRKDFSSYERAADFCGHGLSPLIDDGTVYVNFGNETNGSIAAFELATGRFRWEAKKIRPSYASPMIYDIAGQRQLITLTFDAIVGLDPKDGKLLWQYPYEDKYRQNIPTPLRLKQADGDLLFFGNVDNGSMGAKLERANESWQLKPVWSQAALTWYMSSPVTDGQYLYSFTNKEKGQLVVLEPLSGKVLWRSPGRQGDNALLTLAGEFLLVTDTNGELKVWKKAAGGTLELTHTYELATSPIWSHAAYVGDVVLVKDQERVIAHRLAPPASTP